ITFEIERSKVALEAEIYLSVDRARANARRYRQPPELEILHLVIHGVLHLAGYDDKSTKGKKQMRERERWYLVRFRPSGPSSMAEKK
ncbi:MAG: rRNA maturation RNase YbeY, partial [Candidatus Kapaibacterium sp.]